MSGCLLVVLLLWIAIPFAQFQATSDCPQYCSCSVWQKMKKADCVQKNIVSADVTVPQETEVLDLAGNVITSLSSNQFHGQGLTSLKLLSLSRNHIKHIDMHSFQGLLELRYLDLSNNHIYYILPTTFENLPKLRVLNLSSNKLREWTTNLRIPSLQVLDISSCQINSIGDEVFSDLPQLSSLHISNNYLHHLKVDLFTNLKQLKEVVLFSNPWTCDEEMSKLKDWFHSMGTNFKGLCEVTQESKTDSEKFQRLIEKHVNDHPKTFSCDFLNILDENEDVELTTSSIINSCDCPPVKTSFLHVPVFDSIPSFWAFVLGFQLCAVICITSLMVWQRTCCKKQGYRNTDIHLTERILSTDWDGNGIETPPPAYRSIFLT